MASRDDGEFELILGNKQLLSVLFIVIVLLGVFFAMGFLAGRTTGPAAVVAQNDTQDRSPLAVDSATSAPPVVTSESSAPPPAPAAQAPTAPVEPAAETKAPPPAQAKKAEEPAPAKPAPAAAPKPDSGGFIATPPAGVYLQAAATRRADAEAMLAGIRTKTGLPGYITPTPKSSELFRVIIGPLTKAQQAPARMALGEIGVKAPFPVTY